MPTDDRPYTLSEIASIAGVTPRTVRYYLAQGLLPAPGEVGRGPHYDDGHLARLRLIRDLQRRHLPLAEIRRRLASMSDEEVEIALSGAAAGAAESSGADASDSSSSALDYIRAVLGEGRQSSSSAPVLANQIWTSPSTAPPAPGAAPGSRGVGMSFRAIGPSDDLADESRSLMAPAFASPTTPTTATTPTTPTSPTNERTREVRSAERSQWDRIALTPDIELHVRRPLSRLDNKRVERLITIARQVLQEGQP